MSDLFHEVIVAQRIELLLRLINKSGYDNKNDVAIAFDWLGELMAGHTENLYIRELQTPRAGGQAVFCNRSSNI